VAVVGLRPLPDRRLENSTRVDLEVGPSSTIRLRHNTYSVDSRLIGETVDARLFSERIEVWYAQKKVDEFPRLRGENGHRVNYRHVIEWLVRKPGAFENYRYREDMFPSSLFRTANAPPRVPKRSPPTAPLPAQTHREEDRHSGLIAMPRTVPIFGLSP